MDNGKRILIVGSGPTGLGAAWRLNELGHTNWRIIERSAQVGGLAASFRDDHGFTWDFAVHVAHSHYHYFDRLMETVLPDGFYHHERRAWVREYGAWVPYPFQYNFRNLPERQRNECLEGLRAIKAATLPVPANFDEWIQGSFGDGIARHFMTPYNRKIWCTHPRDMNCHWLGDRVPVVDLERVERNLREGRDDVSWGPNHTFQFPKTGGTGAIWEAMAAQLPRERISLSTDLVALDPVRRRATLSDGTVEAYDAIVSTMPIPRLTRLVGDSALHAEASGLRYTHVQVAGVACNFPIPAELADKTWVYCPEDTIFYRVTPFSIFSPAHVPDVTKHCSFMCEISTPPDATFWPDDEVERRTLEGLRASGLVQVTADNARVFHLRSEFGYPVPTVDRDERLNRIVPGLERLGLYSRGRFGGWKYEVANMDHSVMQGVEAVNRILLGEDEITWKSPNVVNAGKR